MACIRFDNNQISWWDSTLHTFDLACTKIPEDVPRNSIIDVWKDYEFAGFSTITGVVEFDRNVITLSRILESKIR